jgi:hypothetical protein
MKKSVFKLMFLVFILLFASCEADVDLDEILNEITLEPNLIVPLGSANLTLAEILSQFDTNGKVAFGSNNEIDFIKYDSTEFKFNELNFIEKATELDKTVYFPTVSQTHFPPNSTLPPIISDSYFNLGLNTGNDHIDSIIVNSAIFSFQITPSAGLQNLNPSDITLSILFSNGKVRKLNGNQAIIALKPASFGSWTDVSLSDFVFNTTGNQSGIPVQIKIEANTGSNTIELASASNFNCKILLKELNYKVAYGLFGGTINSTAILNEKMDLVTNLPNGVYNFIDPQIDISTTSNIGAYMNFKLNFAKAILSTNPNFNPIYALFDGQKSTVFQFNRKPGIPGDTVMFKLRTMDKDWGQTNLLFLNAQKPDFLEYYFIASIDSNLTKQSKTPNFLTPDAKVSVRIKTTVPIFLSQGSYYQYNDSIQNVFEPIASALDQYSEINTMALILNITNGLPVQTQLSVSVVDSTGTVIPTDFKQSYSIASGKVDAEGIVQKGNETNQSITISVSKDQLTSLRKAKMIKYNVRIDGNSNSNIHFTKDNIFNLKVGIFVKGDLKVKLRVKK